MIRAVAAATVMVPDELDPDGSLAARLAVDGNVRREVGGHVVRYYRGYRGIFRSLLGSLPAQVEAMMDEVDRGPPVRRFGRMLLCCDLAALAILRCSPRAVEEDPGMMFAGDSAAAIEESFITGRIPATSAPIPIRSVWVLDGRRPPTSRRIATVELPPSCPHPSLLADDAPVRRMVEEIWRMWDVTVVVRRLPREPWDTVAWLGWITTGNVLPAGAVMQTVASLIGFPAALWLVGCDGR